MKPLKVISLFDGCGMAYQAIKDCGFKVDKYYSSEIDEYSIKIAKKNHPDIIHIGDITKVDFSQFKDEDIDLVIGGSPCQGFSIAGKKLNFQDERSKLILYYFEAIEKIKPKRFLLENVIMDKSCKNEISRILGVRPIQINSKLLTAQNRERLYWTNILNVELPVDKKIYLKDIIQSGAVDRDKSYCICSNYDKFGSDQFNLKEYFTKSRRQILFDKPLKVGNIGCDSQGQRVYDIRGKSSTLTSGGGGQGGKTGLYCIAQRGRNIIDGKRMDEKGAKCTQRLEPRFDGKTNCLTTVQKDNYIFKIDGEDYIIRKLTPIECERLQGLTDNYTEGVSNNKRYTMIGNGFTVPVISHILKNIYLKKGKRRLYSSLI